MSALRCLLVSNLKAIIAAIFFSQIGLTLYCLIYIYKLSKGDRVKLQALPDNRDGCAVRKFFIPPGTIGIIAEAPTFPVTWIKVLVGDKEIGMRTSNFVRLDPPSREIDPSQRQMVMDRLQRTVCFNILHDNLRVKIQVKNKLYDGVVSKAPNFPS